MGVTGRRAPLAMAVLIGALLLTAWLLTGEKHPESRQPADPPSDLRTTTSTSTPNAAPSGPTVTGAESPESPAGATSEMVVLRDLADGNPIPGVGLELQPVPTSDEISVADPPRVQVTGNGGDFLLGDHEVPRLPADASGWIAPRQSREEILDSGVFWAYRQIEVAGVVRPSASFPPLDLHSIRLTLVPVGGGWADLDGGGRGSPGSRSWLHAHGLSRWPLQLGSVDGEGRFAVRVPRIKGLCLVADADGWRAASEPVATQGDSQTVDLILGTAIRISGKLRSFDGTPLANAKVVLYVTRIGGYESVKPGGSLLLLQPEGGSTGVWNKEKGTSRVTLSRVARSDGEGRFSTTVKADGEVRILVYADGHSLSETVLGSVDEDRGGLDIRVERAKDVGPIRLRYGDEVLRSFALLVSDLSVVDQPAVDYWTDEEGRLKSEWFVNGKLYALIPQDAAVPPSARCNHYLLWRGETDIDLKALPTKHP